jgi:hypothetical protein
MNTNKSGTIQKDGLDKNNKYDIMNVNVADVSQTSSQKRSTPSQGQSSPKRPIVSSKSEEPLLSRSSSIEGDVSVQVISEHGCNCSDDNENCDHLTGVKTLHGETIS